MSLQGSDFRGQRARFGAHVTLWTLHLHRTHKAIPSGWIGDARCPRLPQLVLGYKNLGPRSVLDFHVNGRMLDTLVVHFHGDGTRNLLMMQFNRIDTSLFEGKQTKFPSRKHKHSFGPYESDLEFFPTLATQLIDLTRGAVRNARPATRSGTMFTIATTGLELKLVRKLAYG